VRRAWVLRTAPIGVLAVLMALFGYGVYRVLGHFSHIGSNTGVLATPQDPRSERPAIVLPGTIYVAQAGDLYALRNGQFTLVLAHGDAGMWMQPTVLPDGRLIAVARAQDHADLYLLDANGNVLSQLTHNLSPPRKDGSLEDNHWSFHPRLSADQSTLYMDFDSPKNGFLVDFAIWSVPWPQPAASPSASPPAHLNNTSPPLPKAKQWTTPNDYTGGDVEAMPLPGGQVVFVRYLIDGTFHVHSQIELARTAGATPVLLTDPADDCSQSSLSADGTHIAMACTHGQQTANVEVARLNIPSAGSTPPTLVERSVLVSGGLAAFPTWAPDGSGLAYLSPAAAGGNFQLWWLRGAGGPTPAAPEQVTTSVGLDATSAPAWALPH
jgi:hypothetical protein